MTDWFSRREVAGMTGEDDWRGSIKEVPGFGEYYPGPGSRVSVNSNTDTDDRSDPLEGDTSTTDSERQRVLPLHPLLNAHLLPIDAVLVYKHVNEGMAQRSVVHDAFVIVLLRM